MTLMYICVCLFIYLLTCIHLHSYLYMHTQLYLACFRSKVQFVMLFMQHKIFMKDVFDESHSSTSLMLILQDAGIWTVIPLMEKRFASLVLSLLLLIHSTLHEDTAWNTNRNWWWFDVFKLADCWRLFPSDCHTDDSRIPRTATIRRCSIMSYQILILIGLSFFSKIELVRLKWWTFHYDETGDMKRGANYPDNRHSVGCEKTCVAPKGLEQNMGP